MTTELARRLRRNMTEAEQRLWSRLRSNQLGVKFRRQMPIDRYIADFVSEHAKLVVEVDGGKHSLSAHRDAARDAAIAARGFLVLRFWNDEVAENIDAVMDRIRNALSQRGVESHGS